MTYSFEEFGQLASRLRVPFKAEVDRYRVNVIEQHPAIMMDDLA
jgi:hypothetical protein